MDLLTQRHLVELRDALLDRMNELRAEVDAADPALRGDDDEREAHDFKDEAARRADDEVGAGEVRRDIDELRQVQAALFRIDAGVYGDCVDCGEPIAFERLQVQPAAERCATCQALYETRPRVTSGARW